MSPLEGLALFAAGFFASGINSVAGGGSLLSFPALTVGLGMPNREANATNAVGLFPGSFAGGVGFLSELAKTKKWLVPLLAPTVFGSLFGAYLMLATRETLFRQIVPFLILGAALLLWFQPKIRTFTASRTKAGIPFAAGIVIQFLVATYGGYFGAGMGIMMLASFSLYMEATTHELNAVKNWLGSIINLVCSAVFVAKGLVDLPIAAVLALGGVLGGFTAARVSLKVDPEKLRRIIAIYGFAMTLVYWLRLS
jgi:uncharacterized protein